MFVGINGLLISAIDVLLVLYLLRRRTRIIKAKLLVQWFRNTSAFGHRCIPSACVAPQSQIPDLLLRRAWPDGCFGALGARGISEPLH